MIDPEVLNSLKERYNFHPLMFKRSVEKSKTNGELFDILDTAPKTYPIVWNEKKRRWEKAFDIFLSNEFIEKR